MTHRLLELLAQATTRHRIAVLVGLAMVVLALGSRIPTLDSDPSPNNLRAAYGGQDVIEANLKQDFGDTDRIVLVLLESPDMLEPEPIAYLHRLSRQFQGLEGVRRVDSITVTPLPHSSGRRAGGVAPPDDPEVTDLEAAIAGEKEADETDLEAVIAGDAPLVAKRAEEPDVMADLATRILPIVQGDSEHFPRGLRSLSERANARGLRGGPVVRGDEVTGEDLDSLRAAVDRSPLVQGRLISHDQTVAAIALTLDANLVRHDQVAITVQRIDAVLASSRPPSSVVVKTGGLPHLRQQIVEKMRHDQRWIMPGALLVCVLLLTVAFRWAPGVMLPLGAVTMTAVMLLGIMALAGVQLNIINNILPTMLVITGISDSIHLIARYRFEVQRGSQKLEACRTTVHALGVACFLTSLTTAVGFSSLAVASTPMLRHFGLLAAGGVMLAYLVTVTFLPSALMVLPKPKTRPVRETSGAVERWVVGLTRCVVRRPGPVLGVAGLVLAGCLWGATQVKIDMRLLDMFDKSDPVYATTHTLETKLQGMRPLELVLRSTTPGRFTDPQVIATLDEVQAWAAEQDGVLGTFSCSDILHEVSVLATGDELMRTQPFRTRDQVEALITVANAERDDDGRLIRLGSDDDLVQRPLARYLTPNRQATRITLMFGDIGARRSMELIHALEGRLNERLGRFEDVRYELTGEAYLGSFGINAIVTDLFYGLLLATIVIFLILTLLFRNLVLGLVSIPPNLLPLAGTLGYMYGRGFDLTPANVIIFAISIGLAVSGSIHVIARYREELSRGLGSRFALVRAARSTGKAIVFTSIILSLGFSVLVLSSFVTIRQFGELIAVTIAACLLATVIVQPALLAVTARFIPKHQRNHPPAASGQ